MRYFIVGVLTGVIAVAVGLALAVWFWPWQVEAVGIPGQSEIAVMRILLDRALKRVAPRLANPFPPSPENLTAGMKIFREGCAGCDGDGLNRSTWGTTSFFPRVPQFATEPPNRPDWQIYWIVRNGIRNTGMGAWKQLLTDDQIWQVTGFVSHINSLPEDVSTAWHKRQ